MWCKLARYGRRELLMATALLGGLVALLVWAFWPAAAVPALLWGWVLWFFRDPDRTPPSGAGLWVSPADGRVTDVTRLGADSALGCDGVQVGVFMSIFDVHVNRSPCAGRVERIEYRRGSFVDARDPRASEQNESATIHLSVDHGGRRRTIVFRQIAGILARRIVTEIIEGDELRRGQRVGMVKFGSRCELLVPEDLAGAVRARVGQKVRAGRTVLIEAPAPDGGRRPDG